MTLQLLQFYEEKKSGLYWFCWKHWIILKNSNLKGPSVSRVEYPLQRMCVTKTLELEASVKYQRGSVFFCLKNIYLPKFPRCFCSHTSAITLLRNPGLKLPSYRELRLSNYITQYTGLLGHLVECTQYTGLLGHCRVYTIHWFIGTLVECTLYSVCIF